MTRAPKSSRPVILALIGAMWPGNYSSGAVIHIRRMIDALGDEFDFKIVARDRPPGARAPLAESGRWLSESGQVVRYCPMTAFGAGGLDEILRDTPHDLLMLNGFYALDFTIPALVLRRIGRTPRRPTLLTPHGEFATGAANLNQGRKTLWRAFARLTGLLADVSMHATSEAERDEIKHGFPWAADYLVAPNVRTLMDSSPRSQRGRRPTLAFIGRISRVKNLDYALQVLANVETPVTYEIYGPKEDAAYWSECERMIASLPAHIEVNYRGEFANAAVPETLTSVDLLFMPSQSENFGHAIFEALSCGVPVLIADTTPWRRLAEAKAGWNLPLSEPGAFARSIDTFFAFGEREMAEWRDGARGVAERSVEDSDAVAKTRAMLNHMLDRKADATAESPHRHSRRHFG